MKGDVGQKCFKRGANFWAKVPSNGLTYFLAKVHSLGLQVNRRRYDSIEQQSVSVFELEVIIIVFSLVYGPSSFHLNSSHVFGIVRYPRLELSA